MPEITPFPGIFYDPRRVDLGAVVTLPYDVITPAAREVYEARHSFNIIRVELPKALPGDDDREIPHRRAASCLRDWLASGVLVQDPAPTIYPYVFESSRHGSSGPLTGFITAMRLEPCGPGRVMAHEDTFPAPKEDRLQLLRACRANTSLIIGLVPDPADAVFGPVRDATSRTPPRLTVTDEDGVAHRVWQIADDGVIGRVREAMRPKPVYLADGHHRYEAALAYSREAAADARPEPAAAFVMLLLLRMEDPALTILPTHRVVHGLPAFKPAAFRDRLGRLFTAERIAGGTTPAGLDRLRDRLRAAWERRQAAFGLFLTGEAGYDILFPKAEAAAASGRSAAWSDLDVSIFQRLVLDQTLNGLGDFAQRAAHVLYTKSDEEAVGYVRDGTAQAAFLLNPTRIEQLKAVVEAGARMPHKSTYFYPKPLTGLVLRAWGSGVQSP